MDNEHCPKCGAARVRWSHAPDLVEYGCGGRDGHCGVALAEVQPNVEAVDNLAHED